MARHLTFNERIGQLDYYRGARGTSYIALPADVLAFAHALWGPPSIAAVRHTHGLLGVPLALGQWQQVYAGEPIPATVLTEESLSAAWEALKEFRHRFIVTHYEGAWPTDLVPPLGSWTAQVAAELEGRVPYWLPSNQPVREVANAE